MSTDGHLRKRGATWAFVVELDRDPTTGRRRQRWVSGFATKDEARAEMRTRLSKLDRGEDPFPATTTLASFVNDRWLPHLTLRGKLRPGTIRNYRQIMRQHVLPRIGHVEMAKVKPAHCQLVLDELAQAGRAPRTVAHVRAAMSGCFQWALRQQVTTTNPARATDAPDKKAPVLRTPSPADLVAIIAAAKGTRWEVAVLLSATTACRRGEVLGLKWRNVDLDNGRIRVVESLQRVSGVLAFAEPKTERSTRMVPLLPEVVERLRQHRIEQAERLLAVGVRVTDNDVVLDRGNGQPIEPSTYGHAAARIAAKAGVPCRLHDLRHGVANMLAARGNRAELTSKLLGHSTVAFTLQQYVHPSDDEMDTVGTAIGAALGGTG